MADPVPLAENLHKRLLSVATADPALSLATRDAAELVQMLRARRDEGCAWWNAAIKRMEADKAAIEAAQAENAALRSLIALPAVPVVSARRAQTRRASHLRLVIGGRHPSASQLPAQKQRAKTRSRGPGLTDGRVVDPRSAQ